MAVQRDAGQVVSASAIRCSRVKWLRRGWIPLGGISLLAGPPGIGKSTLAIDTVARLSRGELTGSPQPSLIVTAEDSLSAVVAPRLRAAEADMDLVLLPEPEREDALWLPDAVAEIRQWVEQHGVKLVVLDPLTAFLPDGKVDTWRDSSVRGALAPLARMADRYQIAVLAVVHLNKGGSSDPIRRVGGSIGLPAAARSVLLLAGDPDYPDSDRRVLAHAKSNFGRLSRSVLLEIRESGEDEPSRIVELGSSPHAASDLLGEPENASKLEEAMDFLAAELAAGPRGTAELLTAANADGISEITLRRAKRRLDVGASKVGFKGWEWALPQPDDTTSNDAPAA